ncbi:hypothetical protein G4177_02895 [Corallococcus sp. ZKHCc1 1396]|uniref:Uncharacterized protein n=1 Tax=Corallococcus soli TaxID=2710757 RepID=A0ABR9PGT1_9BACT|nr:hypothetical protein [Corallococcus soli]MBE4747121.1 hypothetical protein [Corallococcus soli]
MTFQWKKNRSLVRNALGLGLGVGILLTATPVLAGDAKADGCTEFSGMAHCPLAGTELHASNEGLVVKSTDGKQAGVSIDLNDATGWDAWLSPLEPDFDSRMLMTFTGALPDGSPELRERVVVARSKQDDQGAIYVDASVHGATSYTVRGYNDGKLVFTRTGVKPVQEDFVGRAAPGGAMQLSKLVSFPGRWGSAHGVMEGPNGETCTPGLDFPSPRPVRFPDYSLSVAVQLVTFQPEGVALKSRTLREVTFQADGLESFTLQKEVRTP